MALAILPGMHARRLDARYDKATSTLVLVGELDDDVLDEFRACLREATADFTQSATVDLTAVTYLPSSALGVLVAAVRRSAGAEREVDLVAAKGTIAANILAITGLPNRAH